MVFIAVTCRTTDGSGNDGVNVWHANVLTTPLAAANDFIADLDAFYTTCAPLFGTTTNTVIGESVRTVETPAVIVPAAAGTAAGSVVSTIATPPQLAAVISWRTALAGRSYRGRNYLGPLVQGALSGQNLSSTVNTAMGTAAGNLITASDASTDYEFVVLSRFSGGVERPSPIGTVVTGYTANIRVETQRRRNQP